MGRRAGLLAAFVVLGGRCLPACGDDSAAVAVALADDGVGAGADAGALADGWQYLADAAAPDGWVWSEDAQVWLPPDALGAETTAADTAAVETADKADGAGADTALLGDSATDGSAAADGSAATDGSAADGGAGGDVTAKPGELGGFCDAATPCPNEAFCVGQGSPQAYCTLTGCASHADCAPVLAADPVCCISYGAGTKKQSYCGVQFGATVCGNQDKPVGADCASGGQSDCAGSGNWCFQTSGGAQCVQGCSKLGDAICGKGTTCNVFPGGGGCLPFTPGVSDGSPCAKNTLGGCDKYAFCIESYKGDPLAYCATACTSDAGCAADLSCFVYDGSQGICQKTGTKGIGANCAGDRFSCAKGSYCVGFGGGSAVCAPQCSVDLNCGELAKAIGGEAYCAKNPGNPAGICYPKGPLGNGATCADNPYACAEGLYCIGGYDTYNPGAFCQKSCKDDGICPGTAKCMAYTKDYSGCQPDGALGQGGDCKGDPTLCKAGAFCIGAGKSWQCMTQCAVAKPACPGGNWCMPYGEDGLGICWPIGTKPVGAGCQGDPWGCQAGTFCSGYGASKAATCLQNCDAAACPGGFSCDSFGQSGKWCQPVGPGQQGVSCGPGAACVAGAVCIGQQGPAPFCAKQCAVDSDCPAKDASGKPLWCAVGKWGGYCVPDGGTAKNGICYQAPWSCAKGLVCVGDSTGNPGAFCAAGCAGFASTCAGGEKCVYLGGGDAFCVKTGTMPAGSICLQDPFGCAADALCIKGSPMPECLQQCGVGFAACPKDSPCTGFPGAAIKLCVPKDFVPFGMISVPF